MGSDNSEWTFQRIGTAGDVSSVAKERQDLLDTLSKVEGWKRRRAEIEQELNTVWTEDGELDCPPSLVEAKLEPERPE